MYSALNIKQSGHALGFCVSMMFFIHFVAGWASLPCWVGLILAVFYESFSSPGYLRLSWDNNYFFFFGLWLNSSSWSNWWKPLLQKVSVTGIPSKNIQEKSAQHLIIGCQLCSLITPTSVTYPLPGTQNLPPPHGHKNHKTRDIELVYNQRIQFVCTKTINSHPILSVD